MSKADTIFIQNCKDILENGVSDVGESVRPRWSDGKPAHTIKKFGIVNRYDLQEEFPIQTIRRMYLKSAVDELLWIWQKKSNRVNQLSSHVWDAWADEVGSIGKSYGYQLGQTFRHHRIPNGNYTNTEEYPSMFVDSDGWVHMDQVDAVLYDLFFNYSSRRILTNMYNHQDLADMQLHPCAYSVTFNVSENTLNAILHQRSQDMLTANGWNVMQYAVLLHMIAQSCYLNAGELVHVIADAHIYDRHIPIVQQIIQNEPLEAPHFYLDREIHNFYKFSTDNIHLENYRYHDSVKEIPVAI